jgi:lipoprotein-anchoring transpeptidase ErfK/SrfK
MRQVTRALAAAIVGLLALSLIALPSDAGGVPGLTSTTTTTASTTTTTAPPPPPPQASQFPPLPADSGVGRRIVYSKTEQRVWLVEEDGTVSGSWLVSGRRNLPRPGEYRVYSKSMWSRSGSSRLQYMVRFAHGRRLRIGFHAIPINRRGRPIQSESQLGTPRSNGCVRQRAADAATLWNWAPIGTVVRVTP